jgi:hypothetical protein
MAVLKHLLAISMKKLLLFVNTSNPVPEVQAGLELMTLDVEAIIILLCIYQQNNTY